MQNYYKCDEGYEDQANVVLDVVAKNRLSEFYHETRLSCIIKHYGDVENRRVDKQEAREMVCQRTDLTKEQYLNVSTNHLLCFLSFQIG
jgi:hypothetical protein